MPDTSKEAVPCVCCNEPVTRPSMGGWTICGLCDTGYCGGKQGHAYAQRYINELAAVRAERDAALRRAEATEKFVQGEVGARATAERLLQAVEERVRVLADLWDSQANDYPEKYAAAAVRLCARELRAALAKPAPEPVAHEEERE